MKTVFTFIALVFSVHAFSQSQLQKEASGLIQFASQKVIQLADIVPEEKYSWAPEKDVRSFASVFTHIVSANYFFGSKLGGQIPAGVNMATLESDLKTKNDIVAALKQSYDFVITAVKATKDDAMAVRVEYPFPGEFTNMSSVLIAVSHSTEHLGQLIAYARVNGIKPPWSE
jgi:uncharacterized damage-inducible protein DinB